MVIVRRAMSDDSQKENTGVRDRRSQTKSGSSKGKRETLGKSKLRRVVNEEEAEEEETQPKGTMPIDNDTAGAEEVDTDEDADEEEEEGANDSPRVRKRARANSIGESVPSSPAEPKEERRVTLPRDTDGYVPGSIVRIQLRNFVTYDYVEFSTGPYLNMILGPNGTGKSSIACAICLGLNFPPSVLGRSSELNSFVKIGTNDGHIEIELKGPRGEPNLVIRRSLTAKQKSSKFHINNKSATGKEVNAAMARLNVQVSNLCSFLPQDKVAEFARMSPQQLLKETQRAAGNENLTRWHETLIAEGKVLKEIRQTLDADKARLKNDEEGIATLEREVKRFKERRQIEKRIALLELILPASEYKEARARYDIAKAEHREVVTQVKKLTKKHQPMLALKQAMERQYNALDRRREAKKTQVKNKFTSMRRKWDQVEALEAEGEDLKGNLDTLKADEKKRLNDIKQKERNIAELEQRRDNPPEFEDIDGLQADIKNVKIESHRLGPRQQALQDKQRAYIEDEATHKKVIHECTQRLKNLEDLNHRKFMKLAQDAKDCAAAVDWIRKNRDRFKKEVLEPPALSVNIPDQRYAKAIEACFSQNQMRSIVPQCEEDYQLINRMLVDSPEGVGRRLRLNTWFRPNAQISAPPMNQEELASCGFDGYALDFVDCPEDLKYFLQCETKLHRVAIGVDGQRVNGSRATDFIIKSGGSCSFVAGDVMNKVIRSRYGKQLAQNSTRDIRNPQCFTILAVDPQAKLQAEQALTDAQHQLDLCQERSHALTKEESEIRDAHNELKRTLNDLERRKSAASKIKQEIERTKTRLSTLQRELETLRNRPPPEKERANLKKKILGVAKRRMELLKDYEKLVKELTHEEVEATRVGLQFLQIGANKAYVETLCQDKQNELDEAMERYNTTYEEFRKAKHKSKELLDISKAIMDAANPDLYATFEEMENSGEINSKSSSDWKDELEEERQKLEATVHTNANVLEKYEKKVEEINELRASVESREAKARKKERQIETARNNWEPALQELVESVGEKFSAAFERIGCAGEIKISRHEDYDKWAIDILVKFRDHEKLQLLTGERQSGGERSLTTILYLMSLTEEARTPFSLVDEINQGMDARAERAVHNSLVEVTCKEESGQYFLITPKLLPDLKYHERMRILCVNNGEWLPDDTSLKVGNLMGLIESYVRNHSRQSA